MTLIEGPGEPFGYSAEEVVKTQTTIVSNRLGNLSRGYNARRAQNVATNDQTTTRLGVMAPAIYDPEWIAWLSGDI